MRDTNVQNSEISQEEKNKEEIVEILDKVEKLEPEQREQTMLTLEMHHGPIPHPEILRRYDELVPGAAKQIIDNGVQESIHRRELEKTLLNKTINEKKRGQYLGFSMGIIVIIAGCLLIYTGHVISGTLLSGTSLLGLVATFTGSASNLENKNIVDENHVDD